MKYRFLVLSILMSQFLFAQEADYIIRNGKLIDGTGNQWQIKDVAIINNKIAAIGTLTKWKGKKEIDAKGLIVSPGFIFVAVNLVALPDIKFSVKKLPLLQSILAVLDAIVKGNTCPLTLPE